VQRLHYLERLTDELMLDCLRDGHLLLFLAALALRCRLSLEAIWEVLLDPRGTGPAFLLRAAGIGRGEAGPILLLLAGGVPTNNEDDLVARQLETFDGMSQEEARGAISLWTVDAAYRLAVGRVSSRRRRGAA
jgi:hypothetical protein